MNNNREKRFNDLNGTNSNIGIDNSNQQYINENQHNIDDYNNQYYDQNNQNQFYNHQDQQQTGLYNNQEFHSDNNQNNQEFYQQNYEQNSFNQQNVNQINSSNVDKNETKNKWYIPKNVINYSLEEYQTLPEDEKEKLNKIKNSPKKVGRYVEVKNFKNFYRISIFDFLPFFIGSIYSLIRVVVAYGDAKRTVNFNKKLSWDLKNNLLISLIFGFFFWPLLIIALFIFYPYIVYDSSEVTYAWYGLIDEVTVNGASAIGTGLQIYFEKAIVPLFSGNLLIITILFWFFLSMFNIQTFLFYFLYKFNRKTLFDIQKNKVREEILQIKQQQNK